MSADRYQTFSELDQALRSRDLERMARQAERARTYFPRGAFLDCETGTTLIQPVPPSSSGGGGGGGTYGLDGAGISIGSGGLMSIPSGVKTTYDWSKVGNSNITQFPVGSNPNLLSISGSTLTVVPAGWYLAGGSIFWEGTFTAGTDTMSANFFFGSGSSIVADQKAAADANFSGFSPNAFFQALPSMFFQASANAGVTLQLFTSASSVEAVPYLYFVRLH